MGKLGVGGLAAAAFVAFALLPFREAGAQDFGQTWIDRITHELEQERGPLQAKPLNITAQGGVNYAYDSNIFLTNTQRKKDSIIIPFVEAGLTYGEPKFDVEASLLADYKIYVKEKADDDEERLFLRARQTASRWNFEISEILQNVSDPAGLLFLNRVSRVVSNTIPKVAFDIGRSWAIEVGGNIQIVRFKEQPYATQQENNNFSLDVSVIYRTPWAWDLVAEIGYYNINYLANQSAGGTPDVFGYYYRGGFRGSLVERLTVEALIGYTSVDSDFFIASGNDLHEGTGGGMINLRYEATETMNLFFDAARQYAFNGFGDPYQLLDTVSIYLKWQATETFMASVRIQADHSHSALNVSRKYYGAAVNGSLKITPNWIGDLGISYRGGDIENAGVKIKFTDFILSLGFAYAW
ncbi:MAG: hypothetical protein HY293_03610 [Planctomycetes bacterium]|nr:hypothetical protein [Planctomycetota bacterium]